MEFDFNGMIFALSYALDCVERDLVGVTTNHGKRVASIAIHLGRELGSVNDNSECQVLSACAVLHDCALSEYVQDEFGGSFEEAANSDNLNLGKHCAMGEKSVRNMPFNITGSAGAILYHHENVDGSGPFHKIGNQIPLNARLIHIADIVDLNFDLSIVDDNKLNQVSKYVKNNIDILFGRQEAELFINLVHSQNFMKLSNNYIDNYLREILPGGNVKCTPEQFIDFLIVFANIVDYKSHFTKTHSIGIAQKAYEMAKYYGVDEDTAAKLYFAGALHDIGKLVVNRNTLEKPDKLSSDEYIHIKTHAYYTYKILSKVPGIEDITQWASRHHEKLDGTGYPFGLSSCELGKWDRLMACIDIYQALTEERPYKKCMSHEAAMVILNEMAERGKLDSQIVNDIDIKFC